MTGKIWSVLTDPQILKLVSLSHSVSHLDQRDLVQVRIISLMHHSSAKATTNGGDVLY